MVLNTIAPASLTHYLTAYLKPHKFPVEPVSYYRRAIIFICLGLPDAPGDYEQTLEQIGHAE